MAINIKSLADGVDLLKRRKYLVLLPWLLISSIAVLVAYNLPKTFRSTAIMLYEAPLPTKIIDSTLSQFADEQIQSIYQRTMAASNVLSIINSIGLYDDIKDEFTDHELADFFRESTEINLTTSSVTPKTNSGMAEIAFELSFSHSDPVYAKEAASKLVSLFIEQNDNTRKQRAAKAAGFLLEESEKLSRQLQDIDNKIAEYKEQYNFSLPEQIQSNLATIDRTETDLKDTDNQIRSTRERISYLEAELARAQDEYPDKTNERVPQNKDEALGILKAQYLKYLAIYSPSHPTMVRLKREIKILDPGFEGQVESKEVVKKLEESRSKLRVLNETYSGNHPDIAKLKTQIDTLEGQLSSSSKSQSAPKNAVTRHSSPAYVGLEAQYKSYQIDLQALQEKRGALQAKLEKMQSILQVAPQVERGYADLTRERDNIVKKYNQLKEKLLDAKLNQTQEEQQQGQMLTILEQPIEPIHPEKAIRRKVAIGGFVLGLFAGLGLALLAEFLDPRLRGYRQVAETTGLMPLVVIPYIENTADVDNKFENQIKGKNRMVWLLSLVIIMVVLAVVFFFSPALQNLHTF